MNSLSPTVKSLVAALLLIAGSASKAAITVYTDQASFLAAVSSPGVDTFTGFSVTGSTPSPINRNAGPYTYTGTASTSSFFGAGTTGDPWLSVNVGTDTISFNNFAPAIVSAVGGMFFDSDINGAFAAGSVTLISTDATGAVRTDTIPGATINSFRGFVSTGAMISLTVTAVQPGSGVLWPTVENLTLAQAPAPLSDDVFANSFE